MQKQKVHGLEDGVLILKIKLKKISKYILIILKMGIYQLEFMDKVPDSAAVNESVKLVKKVK